MDEILCIECNKRPAKIKKRQLCSTCYSRLRNSGKIQIKKEKILSAIIHNKILLDREFLFVRNFFAHDKWIRHPCVFYVDENNKKYTPDFYDGERNVFIEVAGTRQAWDQRKYFFLKAVERFPLIKFEARTVTGSEINLNGRIDWNGADAL